jgi:ankyrin repeat protein
LYKAVVAGNLYTIRALLDTGANVNAIRNVPYLETASHYGHKDVVELLLKRGADVNATNINDSTALHAAAHANHGETLDRHKEVVEMLLKNGAYINAKNAYGWTPLYEATYYERHSIAELLRQYGGRI